MQSLNLPPIDHKVKNIDQKDYIFDRIRKKYIALTPEEWVRQHMLGLLIDWLNYPRSLVKVETGMHYNKLRKRTDIIVMDREGANYLLVECKSANEKINQKTFEQITVYNKTLCANIIVLTNGIDLYCCSVDQQTNTSHFLDEIPACNWK